MSRLSPMPATSMSMVVLAIMSSQGLTLVIADVRTAFMQSDHRTRQGGPFYATQPPSFKAVFGMPVHSIIDGTEIPMESSFNKYTRASTYSQYKVRLRSSLTSVSPPTACLITFQRASLGALRTKKCAPTMDI